MGLREELQKRIERKQEEIVELQTQIREAGAYLQGLQDTLKLIPREPSTPQEANLRPGTEISRARDVLRAEGKPMHIGDLLKALGRPVDSKNRAALAGSLANYVRKGEIFSRPAPNTYGLIEMECEPQREDEPPPSFGTDPDESEAVVVGNADDEDVPF